MPWASGMLLDGPWRAALGPRVPTQKVTSHFSAQLNEWICGALGRLVAAFVKLACMTPFCVVWLSPTASVPPEPLHVVHCA